MRVKLVTFLFVFIAATLAVFPIEAFKVTGVSVSVTEREYTGFCPHSFTFAGRITTNREGTVHYRWLRSDGVTGTEGTLTFTTAGTRTVFAIWKLGGVMGTYRDNWMQIEILAPNSRTSNQAEFDLKCIPRMRAERKIYSVSGRLISYASQAPFLEILNGGQLKVHLTNGDRTIKDQVVTLTSSGIASYSISLINAPGRYCLTVEPVSLSDRIIWERTDPVSIWVELTEASPAAINQNFTFYYGMSGML